MTMIHTKAQRINKEIEIPKKSTNRFHYKLNIKETQSILLFASSFKHYHGTLSRGSSTQTCGSPNLDKCEHHTEAFEIAGVWALFPDSELIPGSDDPTF